MSKPPARERLLAEREARARGMVPYPNGKKCSKCGYKYYWLMASGICEACHTSPQRNGKHRSRP